MLKNSLKLVHFVLFMSVLNFIFFHFPFYTFVFKNVDYKSFGGIVLIGSLMVLMLVMNAFVLYLFFSASRRFGKSILVLFFLINSVAVYFVNTYSVILDETMIGNILNTRYSESSGFFSLKLIVYLVFLGIIPSIFIIKAKIIKDKPKKFFITSSLSLLFIVILIFANATNWLWIDKNSKTLGALAMPWSYTVNISRFYNTNPLLSKTPNLYHFDATSCSTYTTAGVKCILEHKNTDDLYEILPNYLYRNDVDVIWRTSNWGEPPVHIKEYETNDQLATNCKGEGCAYDEVLLTGLKERISSSKKDKIFVVLHTSTSHGPTYSKKYPAQFELFKPVCNSVELGNCSKEELINAYDNTVVYTDYILHNLIEDLKQLKEYNSAMLFVSDHGESLGENNLYMHGLPMSIAPKEQYEIPFIVWVSDHSKQLKPNKTLTQNHVFHSVLKFLDMKSPIYDENMDIFE